MVLNLEYYSDDEGVRNRVLIESALDDIEKHRYKYKQIKDSNNESELRSWIVYSLNVIIPLALDIGLSLSGSYLAGIWAEVYAIYAILIGRPGSVNHKLAHMYMLYNNVNKSIRKVEKDKRANAKEKQKALSDLRKFRAKVEKDVKDLSYRSDELGASAMVKRESARYIW
jgi:hypothetical protein